MGKNKELNFDFLVLCCSALAYPLALKFHHILVKARFLFVGPIIVNFFEKMIKLTCP